MPSLLKLASCAGQNGPKWIENRLFGPKQRPNESYGLSGPIQTTPEAKNAPTCFFLRTTAPGRPIWITAYHWCFNGKVQAHVDHKHVLPKTRQWAFQDVSPHTLVN